MAQIIAGLYELKSQIGAGGGGIVYLGRHMRLEKDIVLKADKRSLSTAQNVLRREVDMLKGLSQTYIPQVYDFVQQDGVVYTVMDYIQGESLDKLLDNGQKLPQPMIVRWACQLLEALSYLHSRPPHGILHGDIKPANIMLKPDGDICLIDFNIALALGENGAVKVGFSRGYASPEHYATEYAGGGRAAAVKKVSGKRKTTESDLTETMPVSKTMTMGSTSLPQSSSPGGRDAVLLDVRSDIYSLGATLYHMISGHRPAQDALKVAPLEEKDCSPAVAAIIRKAMSPEPERRYQTAEEMLKAFRSLFQTDERVVRHKRQTMLSAAVISAMFLAGGACTFAGLKQLEQRQAALTAAEYSANALSEGNVSEALRLALEAIPTGSGILEAPVTAQAQKALTDALGVYDLSEGFEAVDAVKLPAAPFKVVMSPEGTRFAAVYAYETAVYDTDTLEKIAVLPIRESALSDVVFPEEGSMVYAGDKGVTAYDLDAGRVLWTQEPATFLALSGDGGSVAAVDRDQDRAVVYRVSDGEKLYERSFEGEHLQVAANDIFADPENAIFALNEEGTLLAVSFEGGGLMVYDLDSPGEDLILYDSSQYTHFEGGFCGKYFVYAASAGSGSELGIVDTEEGSLLGGTQSGSPYMLKADESGICLANENLLVRLDPATLEQTELAYTDSVNITGFAVSDGYVLVAGADNSFSYYDRGARLMSMESCQENCDFVALSHGRAVIGNRNEPSLRVMKLEDHSETLLGTYDPRYIHDEARISADGKTAMLFGYGGFSIYDMSGQLVSSLELPDAGQIYDQQFRKGGEGSFLEVIWYDGTVRCYSAADGSMISETKGKAPAKDLYEEFYTDRYRIVSSLHEAPVVYELESGRQAAVLEEDSYLTYVTQLDGYLLTEYVSASGERYGLLLDQDFGTVAYLPGLCDVTEDGFVFDDGAGKLRQCKRYSLQELIGMAEEGK